jgi:hypothetical protein
MTKFLRPILRQVLLLLTKGVLAKHKPQIIAVTGEGETSIVRELVFTAVNSSYPARRNLETPEAEFSVPLTVLGYKSYPRNLFHWMWVIIKSALQLIIFKSHFHFLILELDTVNLEVQDFWLKALKPKLVIEAGSPCKVITGTQVLKIPVDKKSAVPYKGLIHAVGNYLDIDSQLIDVVLESVNLAEPRIRFLKGQNSALVIDATHYYFPISLKAVLELVDLSKPTVLISTNPHDLELFPPNSNIAINPSEIVTSPVSTIILRGQRAKVIRKYQYLIAGYHR